MLLVVRLDFVTRQASNRRPGHGSAGGSVLAPILVDRRPGHARGHLIFRTSSALADEMPDRHAGSSIVPRCARQRIGEARCTEEQRREAGCPAGNCVANHWDETLARPWRDDDPCQKGCSMKGVKLLEPLRERQPAMVVLPTPGRPLRTIRMRSRQESAGPGLGVIEGHIPADPLEVPLVLGHEHAARLATRQRQQDIVRERLDHAAELESLLSCHVREQIARTMPDTGRGRRRPPGSLEHAEDVAFERLPVPVPPHAGSQDFLGDDDTEILERREGSMESLQSLIGRRVAKRVDEELSVEYKYLCVVRVTARGLET